MKAGFSAAHAPTVLYGLQHWRGVPRSGPFGRLVHLDPLRYYNVGLVKRGSYDIGIGPECRRLGEGAIFLVEPMSDWSVRPPRGGRCILIAFSVCATRVQRELPGPGLRILPEEPPQPKSVTWWGIQLPSFLDPDLARDLVDEVEFIADMWWRDGLSRLRANASLTHILNRIVLWHADEARHDETAIVAHPAIRAAMLRFFTTPRSFHDVADLAAVANMTVTSFGHCFRRHVGETPAAWLRQQRLRLACNQMRETDRPLHMIAQDLGFTDPAAFSRQFRARYGSAPRQYRRRRS